MLPFCCGTFLGKSVGEFQNWLRVHVFDNFYKKTLSNWQNCPESCLAHLKKTMHEISSYDHGRHDTNGVAQ